MPTEPANPWQNLARKDIESLICFYDPAKNDYLNNLQTDGCYSLWNTLCDDSLRFAYLADEVGMGKTYQALGIVGLLHYLKPDAKVVILCPNHEMQKQWSADWHGFFKEKFCPGGIDGGLKSLRIEANGTQGFESSVQPLLCENLNQFAASLITTQHTAFILRYSSFSLPIRVSEWKSFHDNRNAEVNIAQLEQEFRKCLEDVCPVSDEILRDANPKPSDRLNMDAASKCFLDIYARCLADLVNTFSPDLIVWDEAQYLRTDAGRNESMRAIFRELHQTGTRHLFLSATPAHRDVSDIEKLNHLFADETRKSGSLISIKHDPCDPQAFRRSVGRWMVRRERSFAQKGKMAYRHFQEEPVDLFAQNQSPLYALTFSVMQKNLVKLLAGNNNRFRIGEISCHESARASIEGAMAGINRTSGKEVDGEESSILEESSARHQPEPIDEAYLRDIGASFRALQQLGPREKARELPHAKLDYEIRVLAQRCLENGAVTKELVFVRRVATVDELADGLLREFQGILDKRIQALGVEPHEYWGLGTDDEDVDLGGNLQDESDEQTESFGAVDELPYFKALSAVKGNLGRLTQYRNTLSDLKASTIRFLLVDEQEMGSQEIALWNRFLMVLGVSVEGELYQSFKADSNKALLLRRCVAHSIRFTDILVDLDILRRQNRSGYVERWLDMMENPPVDVAQYFANVRIKLRGWIEHFDTIVNKCFKGGGPHNSYHDIAQRVAGFFRGLSPVARRSGRRKDENAVIQFKFPIAPNVLICTDVLREGVNLHLFCDRISHYGIAWNSGDLEQRIGRVERADSLFERRILKDARYQLSVTFPYLAKTLDERQVKKAIRKKKEVDGLFSIIPPKETGVCDDSREAIPTTTVSESHFKELRPEQPEWEQCRNAVADTWLANIRCNLKKWSYALSLAHQLVSTVSLNFQGFNYTCCRMVGMLDLMVIEWEKLSGRNKPPIWNVCDRQMSGVFERKRQWKTVRSMYIPLGQVLTQKMLELFWANADAGLSATLPEGQYDGFTYCGTRRAHRREHALMHPTTPEKNRQQVSYHCRWGMGHALVSTVVEIVEMGEQDKKPEELASDINKCLPFGCATLLDGCLLLVFPQPPRVMWAPETNVRLAEQLARWADRHQWVFQRGEDDEPFHGLPVAGIADMNTSEAIAVIKSLKSWCEDLCADIGAEFDSPLRWRNLSFNKVIEHGVISCASEMQTISKIGKYQIAFSVSRLDGKPEEKQIIFYLSAKLANMRVVQGDMSDSWDFLSRSGNYEKWLGDDFTTLVDGPGVHYAIWERMDGHQVRCLRLTFPVVAMEWSGGRKEWIPYIAKLASKQLLNVVFQYNQVAGKMKSLDALLKAP